MDLLKKYITESLESVSFSTEQRQRILELFVAVNEDPALKKAFDNLDTGDFLSVDPPAGDGNDTLFFEDEDPQEAYSPAEIDDLFADGVDTFVGSELDGENAPNTETMPESHEPQTLLDLSSDKETLDIGFDTMAPDDFGTEETEIELSTLGRYLDLGLLGRGGMGEIRKVKDLVLNRELAMKIVHSDILSNKNAMARFIEEAQIGAQLQHPNVVPVYELGTLPDGRYYFTMKEIKGREFTDLIQSVHKASSDSLWKDAADGTTFRRLIQIFHQMCETMAFAHSLGVIHRDLKPENVMIGDYGEVLVVDWGIAKVLGQTSDEIENFVQTSRSEYNVMATRMGMIAGTPSYMSPEQAKGHTNQISVRSDVYTLGAILYEILSGKPPYSGTTAIEIVEKVRKTRPPSLFTTGQGSQDPTVIPDASSLEEMDSGKIPLPLIRICERAMEREIKDRYPSVAELASEILGWLEGAQKRDKALKEVEEAQQMRQAALEKEANYAERWAAANHNIQHNGFETEANWSEWNQAQKAWQDAQQLRREHRKKLQGALVYAPDLEEANEALAKLLLEDIVVAIANGERQTREILERQFNRHLQNLSTKGQRELRSLLQRKRSDNILLLRARRGTLVGRKTLRSDIAKVLRSQSRLVSLVGTAGVGKTRLALEVIYDLQEPSTSTYFCDLTEAATELGVALAVAKSMNVKLRNVDPIGQLGELFEQQQTILVLDNLEQVVEPVGAVVTRWMEQSNSLRMIATSRVKLRLAQEHSFPVEPLTMLEGMELFTKRGQQAEPNFSLAEETRQSIGRLVSQLDNLPLAIELAAARLNIFNVDEIEQRLTERFSLLRSRSKGAQALQGALDWSWDLLKPWAKAALTQTSVFRGGFEIKAAENIVQCGEWKESPPVFDILQDLCDDSLLLQNKSSEGEVRFGLLESIRQYAREKLSDNDSIAQGLSGPQATQDTERRHAKHYAQFGTPSFLESLDSRGTQGNWTSFSEELDNFVAGIDYGAGDVVLHCCMAALKILGMKGPVSLGIDIAATVIDKPDTSPRAKKQLQILRMKFLRISGRMSEARGTPPLHRNPSQLQQPRVILTPEVPKSTFSSNANSEELRLEGDQLLEQGNIESAQSFYDKALHCYNEALSIYERIKHHKGIVETRQKMGEVYRLRSEYDKATTEFEYSLILSEETGFFLLQSDSLEGLGAIYQEQGEYPKALELHTQSLEIAQRVGDKFREERSIGNIAIVYGNLGQYENAISQYERALTIAKQIGNKKSEGAHLGHLAIVHQRLEQHDQAITYFKQAIDIAQQIGDKKSEGTNLGNLGLVYRIIGQHSTAISHYEEAIDIAKHIGDKRVEGGHLGNLGTIYQDLGRYEDAISHYEQTINIARHIGNKRTEGIYLGNLGIAYQNIERYEEAISHFNDAIKIARHIGDNRIEGVYLGNLGNIFVAMHRWEEAQRHFEQAIPICKEVIPAAAGAFYGSLAWAHLQQQHLNEALLSLAEGEPLVEVYPLEHAKFLCRKAQVLYLTKQHTEASVALTKAKSMAKALNLSEESELGRSITKAEQTLSPFATEQIHTEVTEGEKEDLRLKADELLEQGNIEEAESQYEKAFERYHNAMNIYQQINDVKGIIEAHLKIGTVYRNLGDYDKATTEYESSLHFSEKHDYFLFSADAQHLIGSIHHFKGNYARATECFNRSLATAQHIGDKLREEQNLRVLGVICQDLGQYEQAISYLRKTLALARQIGNKRSQGKIIQNIGDAHKNLGQYKHAITHYEQARRIAKQIDDTRTEGVIFGALGNVHRHLGQYETAVSHFNNAIEIARQIGNKRLEGIDLGNLGNVYGNLGQYDKAISHYNKAIDIARQIGEKKSEAIFLGNLGEIQIKLEKWREAEQLLSQSIAICTDIQFSIGGGVFKGSLAWVYAQQDRLEKALSLFKEAEPLVENTPAEHGKFLCKKAVALHHSGQSRPALQALDNATAIAKELNIQKDSALQKAIAKTEQVLSPSTTKSVQRTLTEKKKEDLQLQADELLEQGNLEEAESLYDEALTLYTKALEVYDRIDHHRGIIQAQINIAKTHRQQGAFEQAHNGAAKAMELSEEYDLFLLAADASTELGNVFGEQGQLQTALQYFQNSLKTARRVGDKFREERNLGNIAIVYDNLGQHQEAIAHYEQAIDIAQQIGNKRGQGVTLGNLAIVYQTTGQYEQAISHYERSIAIAVKVGDKKSEGVNLGNLAIVYQTIGQYEQAISHFNEAIAIAKQIENKGLEGLYLGNLGDVLSCQHKWPLAHQRLREAIDICITSLPVAAGAFYGSLAWVESQQENTEDALTLLQKGEVLVAFDALEYSKFLCKKAKVLQIAKQPEAASEVLDKATVLAEEINATKSSELGKILAEARQFLRVD